MHEHQTQAWADVSSGCCRPCPLQVCVAQHVGKEPKPAWAQGLRVPHSLWAALLSCARRDVLQPAAAGHSLDAAVASQLGGACWLLRAELGSKWVARPETPAKVPVLFVGEALQDASLLQGGFEGLQSSGDITKEDAAVLNRCYSTLLTGVFHSNGQLKQWQQQQGTAAKLVVAGLNLDLCTRIVEGWRRQLGVAKEKMAPTTAAAYEATCVVRMLGQLQYAAGWKALAEMEGSAGWGQPPSSHALLVVLQGLRVQLQEAGTSDEQLLEVAQQMLDVLTSAAPASSAACGSAPGDKAAAAAPGWPSQLDAQLVEAALRLLLVAHKLFPNADRGGSSSAVLRIGRALLFRVSQERLQLTQPACEVLLDAFFDEPALEQWVAQLFGDAAVEEIEKQALGDNSATELQLSWQGQPAASRAAGAAGVEAGVAEPAASKAGEGAQMAQSGSAASPAPPKPGSRVPKQAGTDKLKKATRKELLAEADRLGVLELAKSLVNEADSSKKEMQLLRQLIKATLQQQEQDGTRMGV